jgi:hypothetical protein
VFLAHALSEKVGRHVTPADFGMCAEPTLAALGLAYAPDPMVAVDTILELGSADVKRRNVIRAIPFALAALAATSRDWLLATLEETAGERGPRAVGAAQVAGIRDMFRLFQEMDVMRGGGHARLALVEYLNSYVIPLVKEPHPAGVQRSLFEVAAEQTYLVGWMAYDDGQHGLAQRYLIQSLRLAQASRNTVLGAHVLAGMSDQANLLGHPREALSLAKAGQHGVSIDDSPACLADLQVLEARAYASLGDGPSAAQAVNRAETTFGSVVPGNEAEWARFIDAAYLFGEVAHCFRDLEQPADLERFAADSATEAGRQGRARRGALSHAALAIAHLNRNNVEESATRALHVVDLAATVSSSRCAEAVRDLRTRLAPYPTVPEVQTFQDRACLFLGEAA